MKRSLFSARAEAGSELWGQLAPPAEGPGPSGEVEQDSQAVAGCSTPALHLAPLPDPGAPLAEGGAAVRDRPAVALALQQQQPCEAGGGRGGSSSGGSSSGGGGPGPPPGKGSDSKLGSRRRLKVGGCMGCRVLGFRLGWGEGPGSGSGSKLGSRRRLKVGGCVWPGLGWGAGQGSGSGWEAAWGQA